MQRQTDLIYSVVAQDVRHDYSNIWLNFGDICLLLREKMTEEYAAQKYFSYSRY